MHYVALSRLTSTLGLHILNMNEKKRHDSDMICGFARPVPELCMLTNTVLDWVYATHGERLTSWNQPFLSRECLESYARTISEKGAPLTNCFGFVDGLYARYAVQAKTNECSITATKEYMPLNFRLWHYPMELLPICLAPLKVGIMMQGYLLILVFLLPCSKWHTVRLVMFYAFMGTEHIHYAHS